MGAHLNNPIAVLHAPPRVTPEYSFSAQIGSAIVPNEASVKLIESMIELAEAEGRPAPQVTLNIDQQGYIVFVIPMVAKHTLLALDPSKVPWCTWRGPLLARIPMAEMVSRYEAAMAKEGEKA